MRFSWTLVMCCIVWLSGCGNGLDRLPDLSSREKYVAQGKADLSNLPKETLAAYDLAVAQLDFNQLRERFSGKSYREIAHAALDDSVKALEAEAAALNKRIPEWDGILEEIDKVEFSASNFRFGSFGHSESAGFDLQVRNGGNLSFSRIDWKAELFLDDAAQPAATQMIMKDFDNGLKPGQSYSGPEAVDTFIDNDWDTLAVRNAKQRTVRLTLHDAIDFSGKSFRERSPLPRLDKIAELLAVIQEKRALLAAK